MRVCFYTLGCKVNLNETGALEQMFRSNGFTIVQEGEPADVFVVNSCTVTNFGDQKSRKWLRRAKRENPGAVTVVGAIGVLVIFHRHPDKQDETTKKPEEEPHEEN